MPENSIAVRPFDTLVHFESVRFQPRFNGRDVAVGRSELPCQTPRASATGGSSPNPWSAARRAARAKPTLARRPASAPGSCAPWAGSLAPLPDRPTAGSEDACCRAMSSVRHRLRRAQPAAAGLLALTPAAVCAAAGSAIAIAKAGAINPRSNRKLTRIRVSSRMKTERMKEWKNPGNSGINRSPLRNSARPPLHGSTLGAMTLLHV